MRENTIFISGPIHGYANFNMNAFLDAEEELRSKGWLVRNPIRNGIPTDRPAYDHMRKDFSMLLECDFIFSLLGWRNSCGAFTEYLISRECAMIQIEQVRGKEVPSYSEFENSWRRKDKEKYWNKILEPTRINYNTVFSV